MANQIAGCRTGAFICAGFGPGGEPVFPQTNQTHTLGLKAKPLTRPKHQDLSRQELLDLVREQEAALSTYKETLGRIYQEFDAKIEELSLIRRVSDVLRQAEDLTGLALGLVEVVISELPADFVCLMLADPEMNHLTPAAHMSREWDAPRPVDEPHADDVVELGQGDLGQALGDGRILFVPDLNEQAIKPWPALLPSGSRSFMALPLVARQQMLGAMILTGVTASAFGQEHARILTILSDHAAAALANVRLIQQLGEINEQLLDSELEAHQSKEYLQRVLDTANDLILIIKKNGEINYANQAAEDIGLSQESLMDRHITWLFADPDRAEELLVSGERSEQELELRLPGGGGRLMLVSVTPMPDSGEVLAILRDITHRRALERQLMHAEKLASVGILAAGVAHEIGNPLSAVSGYAQLLSKDDVSDDERQEFGNAIFDLAQRIDKIIRDLLDYSRPSPFQGQMVEVNQAIEAVLNMFFTSKRLNSYNLTINRDLARNLPPVRMDRDQLQQVVLNMVMNAAQAMEKGGVLFISTGQDAGAWVTLTFADTGPGIAPENMRNLFDPFFTTKPPGQGTGLGLSICDRIINQAGGRIEVTSRLGKGATFKIWLPGGED
jgi:PAS domain S-box-containing protein